MAGVGFELRRLVRQDDLSAPAAAFFGAFIITAGPWLLTVLALVAIRLAEPLVGHQSLARFYIITIYDFAGSLVAVGPISVTINRFLADRLFERNTAAVPGVLAGGLAVALAVQAAIGIPFWLLAADLPVGQTALALAEFFLAGGVWVVIVFMTALKRHAAVTAAFLIGMAISAGGAVVLGETYGADGLIAGFICGMAWILCSLTAQVYVEFPYPIRQPFAFLRYFRTHWELPLAGFVWNLGIWIDKLALWTSPQHELEAGLRFFSLYDSAMFLANLVMAPGMAVFLVQIETRFDQDIRRFYREILGGATHRRIEANHRGLIGDFEGGLQVVVLVQAVVSATAIILAPVLLPLAHAPMTEIGIFRLGALGALLQVVIMFLMITLAYFDLRRRVLFIQIVFAVLNGVFSLASVHAGFAWYGYGYFLASLATCAIAFGVAWESIRGLPYLAFIGNNPALRGISIFCAIAVIATTIFSCAGSFAFAAEHADSPSNGRKFGVYYGTTLLPELSSFDVLVLDADKHPDLGLVRQKAPIRQTLLGYVSLCELGPGRRYADALHRAGLILPYPSEWPGSEMIDIRRPEWRRMVVEEIAPQVFQEGFDGLFLDTLDDAASLENAADRALPGMQDAAVALVHALRTKFPGRPIMMNRGFELLGRVGGDIDMLLAESVMADWQGPGHKPRLVASDEVADSLKLIAAARRRHDQLVVYSLDYWDPRDRAGVAQLYSLERSQGFIPYVATPSLTEIVGEPVQ